ncbi:DUF3185 family protein [Rhodohalobacter sp. 614A]|uniref:DUF3185 family protein n=1 Tax=Rhodohalobacter sp. 614A TaxID=2908649 RepID=UPI001F3CC888|nr:DUF3185 family protein [Rhodohalobacter sp. 614A]
MKKALSAGLFIAGLLLLYFGYQEYQSIGSEVEEFFTGSPSGQAMWMLIGGAVAAVVGLFGLMRK